MAEPSLLDEVQAAWELKLAYAGPHQNRWKSQPDGQKPIREKPNSNSQDFIILNSKTGSYEIMVDGAMKKLVTIDTVCRDVLIEWSSRPDKSLTRGPFASEYSKQNVGVTRTDVLSILKTLGNREYKEDGDAQAVLEESAQKPLPSGSVNNLNTSLGAYPSPAPADPGFLRPESDVHLKSRFMDSLSMSETGLPSPATQAASPMSLPSALSSPAPTSPEADTASSEEVEYPADDQQIRLFSDPRRYQLLREYAENSKMYPDTHLSSFGNLAHHIFENGRPARVWTAGSQGSSEVGLDPAKQSIHGKSPWSYDEADLLLLTEAEHAAWARVDNLPKLIIVRDTAFAQRRPAKSTDAWWKEARSTSKPRNTKLDIQMLGRPVNQPAVENVDVDVAYKHWMASNGKTISNTDAPVNVLNISDNIPGNWPEGLTKEYQLLFDAIAACDGIIYRSLDLETNLLSDESGLGKPTLMAFSPTDIQKCTQFRILAQRGAISSWHIDNVGVYTFIVLEGNSNDPSEKSEDVIKYWPVFPIYHLNAEDATNARADFGKHGINWRPKPAGGIPVIALTKGDMLIQPPGTIHAPITLTDCFFLGGMCWRKSTTQLTLETWHFLVRNPNCTNEPLPRQTHMILDYLREEVHRVPREFGYEDCPVSLTIFDRICDEICGEVVKCRCTKGCSLSSKCSCISQGLRCGIYCHPGVDHKGCTSQGPIEVSPVPRRTKLRKRSAAPGGEPATARGSPAMQQDSDGENRPTKLIKLEDDDVEKSIELQRVVPDNE